MFMKKQLMGLAACALILSSCSQNQEIENYEQLNREEVRLAPYVNKSKASVNFLKDVQESGFKVFAVQHAVGATDYSGSVFMSQLKESWDKTLTSPAWTHTGKYYWPESEALSFFMVAPYYDSSKPYLTDDANANLDITQGASMTLSVKVKDDVAQQVDILAASVLNQTKAQPVVGFTFKHILSRIGFKASMNTEDNLKFKITGLTYSFADVYSGGIFDYTEKSIALLEKAKHATNYMNIPLLADRILGGTVGGQKVESVALNDDASYLMILPQSLAVAAIKVKVTYQIAVAGDEYGTPKTAEINLPAQTYEMSKAYTHNLKFKASAGGLLEVIFGEVGVEEWDEQKPGDINVPK